MSALIQAQHLHRYYADTHAVDDVSIQLHQGDILGLLGPNGAGKSSCMQMLCGVLAPSAGEVLIKGIDLLDNPRQAKQQIGYLADTPPLYPELTVDEYLNYAAHLRRIPKAQRPALHTQAKERCGLENYGRRLIGNLSKGYQQRTGIAQAIIHQPDVIILDEPTIGLDPIQMREIRNLITELGKQHGVILSTHILPEVQAVCNRVQLVHQGKSVFNKPMHDIQQHEQLRLHLQQAPDTDALLKLPAVESIDSNTDGTYILNGKNLQQNLAEISQYCVAQNWGLLEIHLLENSLEQVFIKLTTGEDTTHNRTKPKEPVA
ncbi:MAG TPA: ABC transporter ATP-binding protein [Gammaproteobacteria bacterium]|nr:ABC transporter ATP-binding protein [Gammaproteobacteria bacterium]